MSTQNDIDMAGTEVEQVIDINGEGDEGLRIRVLPGEERGCASFQIDDEDHTLGNALRYMIMKNPKVELCGYSIPHPSENLMNLRIQIYPEFEDDYQPVEALLKGLDDLNDMCDVVADTFIAERDAFNQK